MNAIELLKNDHEKVSTILDKLEPTTERAVKTREDLFARLKEELDLHAHIEERVFYPALERESETRALTLAAYEEHHLVKILLREIDELPVDSEQWTAKFKVLRDNVQKHVEEEEKEIFVKARQALSVEQLDELGTQLEEAKLRRQNEDEDRERTSAARHQSAQGGRDRYNYRGSGGSQSGGGARRGGARSQNQPAAASQVCPVSVLSFLRRVCG